MQDISIVSARRKSLPNCDFPVRLTILSELMQDHKELYALNR